MGFEFIYSLEEIMKEIENRGINGAGFFTRCDVGKKQSTYDP